MQNNFNSLVSAVRERQPLPADVSKKEDEKKAPD